MRSTLTRHGGSLAEPGSVAWQFERKGLVLVRAAEAGEDDLMMVVLDAGAEDIVADGDLWRVTSAPGDLSGLTDALTAAGVRYESADLTMLPTSTVPVTEAGAARQVLKLLDLLDDLDDVQDVHGNFDIGEEFMEELAG